MIHQLAMHDVEYKATLTSRKLNAMTRVGPKIKGKITRIAFEGVQYSASARVVVIMDANPTAKVYLER